MKLRESIRRIIEGPIIDDKPRPPLRGVSFPQNDQRPGLPTPTPRKDVTWQQPAPTTAPVTLPQQLSPDTIWSTPGSVKIQIGPTGKPYPVAGRSPTETPGYGKRSPSGTGLVDQKEKRTG